MTATEATRLEALFASTPAVEPQGQLDLRLYVLRTSEQAIAAAATLSDRIDAGGPDLRGHVQDFNFLKLKILGELAWVRGIGHEGFARFDNEPVDAYVDALRERRRAGATRTSAIDAPHIPTPPEYTLTSEILGAPGWHALPHGVTGPL